MKKGVAGSGSRRLSHSVPSIRTKVGYVFTMVIPAVPGEVAEAGLRALKTVCLTDGVVTPLEASFLDGVQRHIMRSTFDLEALAPISGEELARAVPAGELRERVV